MIKCHKKHYYLVSHLMLRNYLYNFFPFDLISKVFVRPELFFDLQGYVS